MREDNSKGRGKRIAIGSDVPCVVRDTQNDGAFSDPMVTIMSEQFLKASRLKNDGGLVENTQTVGPTGLRQILLLHMHVGTCDGTKGKCQYLYMIA